MKKFTDFQDKLDNLITAQIEFTQKQNVTEEDRDKLLKAKLEVLVIYSDAVSQMEKLEKIIAEKENDDVCPNCKLTGTLSVNWSNGKAYVYCVECDYEKYLK